DKQVNRSVADLEAADRNLTNTQLLLRDAEHAYDASFSEIQQLSASIAERSRHIDSLVRRLPPDEVEMHQQRSELASMRTRLERLRRELNTKIVLYKDFVEDIRR